MKRMPTKMKKTVTVLTDPMPMFNSIVGAGANGTPLRVIKSEELNEEAAMPKNLKNGNADIARLVFRGDNFKTEDAVKAWLTTGGYTETAVKSEEDGSFSVEGSADVAEKHEIELADGVTAYVGEAAAAVEEQAKAEVVAIEGQKTEAPQTGAQKADDDTPEALFGSSILPAMVELTAAKSVQLGDVVRRAHTDSTLTVKEWNSLQQPTREKLLAKAVDAMKAEAAAEPEVTPEVVTEPVAELQPVAEETSVAKADVYQFSEFAYLVKSLCWLGEDLAFEEMMEGQSAGLGNRLKASAAGLLELLREVAASAIDEIEARTKAEKAEAALEAAKQSEAAAAAQTVEAEKAKTESNPVEQTSNSDAALTGIMDAIKGLADQFGTLAAEVKVIQQTTEQSAAKADTLSERLEKIEGTSQTRKSADVEELTRVSPDASATPVQKSAKEISAEVRKRNSLEALGIRTNS